MLFKSIEDKLVIMLEAFILSKHANGIPLAIEAKAKV